METKAIIAYVTCDDVIKKLKIMEDIQSKMTIAEVMTTAIISAIQYSGNLEKARKSLKNEKYIPNMLSKSQLNRRLHNISANIWKEVLKKLYLEFARNNLDNEFVVDSCPIYACKLARQNQTKLYCRKKYLGYCASQSKFFIGFKLHMITDVNGMPIIILLLPASGSDIASFKQIDLNQLPKNAIIYADKAYNDYVYEDQLVNKNRLHLLPIRKKNSKRKCSDTFEKIKSKKRKVIETAFSCIEKLMPRSIHAVTKEGFILKTMLFVIAYAVNKIII